MFSSAVARLTRTASQVPSASALAAGGSSTALAEEGTYPHPKDVANFEAMILSGSGQEAFRAYLREEHSQEHLEFWWVSLCSVCACADTMFQGGGGMSTCVFWSFDF